MSKGPLDDWPPFAAQAAQCRADASPMRVTVNGRTATLVSKGGEYVELGKPGDADYELAPLARMTKAQFDRWFAQCADKGPAARGIAVIKQRCVSLAKAEHIELQVQIGGDDDGRVCNR